MISERGNRALGANKQCAVVLAVGVWRRIVA
jgi:hypothetical protein